MDIGDTARAYEPPPNALAARNILITGVTSGIGRALGLRAATLGARVIGTGRNVKALSAFGDAVVASAAPEPILVPLNLAGAGVDDYADLADRLGQAVESLHGLVLNAGVLGPMSAIRHYDPTEWARVMHINVNSVFLLTRAMLG
ncbi:MAG: SDR family NAD(P)-dependent oxidoreductase, partial [Xanthomonadales bacterium]|nr:SDR family NAD(P)-dependent oxidoreductase [Xanthomonadales bacterium]